MDIQRIMEDLIGAEMFCIDVACDLDYDDIRLTKAISLLQTSIEALQEDQCSGCVEELSGGAVCSCHKQ